MPNEEYGLADSLVDRGVLRTCALRLTDPGLVKEWPRLCWRLPHGDRTDFVSTARQVRLVSQRVKEIFHEQAGTRDSIQWLPADVSDDRGRKTEYWIPHFPVYEDVLDEEHTNFGPGGLPIRWVLARRKLEGLHVFVVPRLTSHYLIHESVGAALARAGATGYTSQKARSV